MQEMMGAYAVVDEPAEASHPETSQQASKKAAPGASKRARTQTKGKLGDSSVSPCPWRLLFSVKLKLRIWVWLLAWLPPQHMPSHYQIDTILGGPSGS